MLVLVTSALCPSEVRPNAVRCSVALTNSAAGRPNGGPPSVANLRHAVGRAHSWAIAHAVRRAVEHSRIYVLRSSNE